MGIYLRMGTIQDNVNLKFKKYTPFVAPVVEEATEESPNEEVKEA